MTRSRISATLWAGTILLSGVLVAYFAWVDRERLLEVWRFWTSAGPVAVAAQSNPFQTGFARAIVALLVGWSAGGLMLGASRRASLAPLVMAAAGLDLYTRADTRDGPTVFLLLAVFLLVLLGAARRHPDHTSAEAAGDQRAVLPESRVRGERTR